MEQIFLTNSFVDQTFFDQNNSGPNFFSFEYIFLLVKKSRSKVGSAYQKLNQLIKCLIIRLKICDNNIQLFTLTATARRDMIFSVIKCDKHDLWLNERQLLE